LKNLFVGWAVFGIGAYILYKAQPHSVPKTAELTTSIK